jgi:hypothetical protein
MIKINGTHEQVERAVKIILFCIVDYVVKEEGSTTLGSISGYTGLNKVGPEWTADALKILVNNNILTMNGNIVSGDVALLTKILEQEKTRLPINHGKPWSEHDYAILAEMGIQEARPTFIAQKMSRTESSVHMATSRIRFAYRAMPWIMENSALRKYASMQNSPNPEV